MEDYGYWIFLLILYILSAFMKRRKQKAAYRKMEEEESGWKAPEFIKELLSDLVETEDDKEEKIVEHFDEVVDNDIEVEPILEYESEIPLEKPHLPHKDLSSIGDHKQIGRIKHKLLRKETVKTSFFKKQQDVKMAVIYKEILDKPRALRRRFR